MTGASVPTETSPQPGLPAPALNLDEPGTLPFTAQRALQGRALNRFALGLRSPDNRTRFLANETAYMHEAGLSGDEMALVRSRDWTGLLLAGGHLQAILKLAATVGESLWSIGAHNVGCTPEELQAACPRRVEALPEGWS